MSLFVNVIAQAAIFGAQPVNLSKALRRNAFPHLVRFFDFELDDECRAAVCDEPMVEAGAKRR